MSFKDQFDSTWDREIQLDRAIRLIREQQTKMNSLLQEYRHSKRHEVLKAKFEKFYILQGHYLMDQDGEIVADTPGRIKSYLNIRSIGPDRILDLNENI